jgi:hypothetical protein
LNEEVEGSRVRSGRRKPRKEYRKLLKSGDKGCPKPEPKLPGKRGRAAKPRSRNLLERLIEGEDEVLRFIMIE